MMQIMKFADRGDTRKQHFQECSSRGLIDLFRSQSSGRIIHLFAPGPESIALTLVMPFGPATNNALKGVRMDIHQARENRPTLQPLSPSEILFGCRKTGNQARFVRKERRTAFCPTIRPQVFR